MFTWINRLLAPQPLPLNETLARLERLSRDDGQQHRSASERGTKPEDRLR